MSTEPTVMGELIMVGDRVLIVPDDDGTTTAAGLILPASVKDKDRIQGGRVINTGPGYLLPNSNDPKENWQTTQHPVKYLPLQAKSGDFAFFLRQDAIELSYKERTHLIVPHSAILALIRDQKDERTIYDDS